MAIYHLNMKVLSRSKGQTAANALAYEAGEKLVTPEGKEVDFTRKGVLASAVIGTEDDLQTLANKMEVAERRKDATVGRRMTIGLPHELPENEQWECAKEMATFLHEEYGLAVVVSMHAPDKDGDQRNTHAHLTMTDRKVDEKGNLGDKARELSCRSKDHAIDGVIRSKHNILKIRQKWEDIANEQLSQKKKHISCKSNEERGIDQVPGKHLGKKNTELKRKNELKGHSYKVEKVIFNEQREQFNKENGKPMRFYEIVKEGKDLMPERFVRRAKAIKARLGKAKTVPRELFSALKSKESNHDIQGNTRGAEAVRTGQESKANPERVGEVQGNVLLDGSQDRKAEKPKPKFGTREWYVEDSKRIIGKVVKLNQEIIRGKREVIAGATRGIQRIEAALGISSEQTMGRRGGVGQDSQATPREPVKEYMFDHNGDHYTYSGRKMPDWQAQEKLEKADKDKDFAKKLWNPKALEKARKELSAMDFGKGIGD